MGYRRQYDPKVPTWQQWIDEHREHLKRIGLPPETFATMECWSRFAAFGDVPAGLIPDPYHAFHFLELDHAQMRSLLTFLEDHDDFRPQDSHLIGFLRVNLGLDTA